MQAIILAAGMGNRLGDLTRDRPKALVPVAGRELILRVLDFVATPAIQERIIVTGYEAARLEAFLDASRVRVRTAHNPHFTDGSIRSIEAALPFVTGDAIILNADHIYPQRMLARVLAAPGDITAICDFDRPLVDDDMKVKLDAGRRVVGIDKKLTAFDGGYIGMTRLRAAAIPRYREAVAAVRRTKGDAANVEAALAHLANAGAPIAVGDLSGIAWLEVDTPEDLARAEQTLTQQPHFLS